MMMIIIISLKICSINIISLIPKIIKTAEVPKNFLGLIGISRKNLTYFPEVPLFRMSALRGLRAEMTPAPQKGGRAQGLPELDAVSLNSGPARKEDYATFE
jgi:hypothetical protein